MSDNGYASAHDGKFWFKTKQFAKAGLRQHDFAGCAKCQTGRYVWRAYVCRQGGSREHWHRGHRPLAGWASQRQAAEAAR